MTGPRGHHGGPPSSRCSWLLDVCLAFSVVYVAAAIGLVLIDEVNAAAAECGNCTAITESRPWHGATERIERVPSYSAELVHTGAPRVVKCRFYEEALVCDGVKVEADADKPMPKAKGSSGK